VETIAKDFVHKKSIKQIVRDRSLSRNTVRKILRSQATAFEYQRTVQPQPMLGAYTEQLVEWLKADAKLPRKQRRNARRLHQGLTGHGFSGAYDSVQRFIKQWKEQGACKFFCVNSQLRISSAFCPETRSQNDSMRLSSRG